MKKICFLMAFLACAGGQVFTQTNEHEEIDFLLFLPNSGSRFVNEDQAMIQLDNVARYLTGRDLSSGQIVVYGYAADFENDIEPVALSRDRALFVMNELHQRGLARDLFAEPVGHGPVDLWGSNIDEEDRHPNRRVRILVDGAMLTAAVVQPVEPVIEIPPVVVQKEESIPEEPIQYQDVTEKSRFKFPWWILLLLPLAALLFLAFKRRKQSAAQTPPQKKSPDRPVAAPPPQSPPPQRDVEPAVPAPPPPPETKQAPPQTPPPAPVPEAPPPHKAAEPPAAAPTKKIRILTEEEISRHAYGLFEQRNGQHGNDVGDWHQAINELTAYYEANGYRVILYWEARGVMKS